MKLTCGQYVTDERFWGRENDVALFIDHVHNGYHLHLTAQRRMGKTSLMQEVKRRLADDYICLFIDLQNCSRAEEAIIALSLATKPYQNLWGKVLGIFDNIIDKIRETIKGAKAFQVDFKFRAGVNAGNWAKKGDQLFQVLADSEKPVLVMLDEVPIMVNRILKGQGNKITPESRSAADVFMSWLRKNSIAHQGKVRIVLSGSIGFEPVLNQANLSATLNTFTPFKLKPWDESTAIGCLNALAQEYGIKFQDNAQTAMVRMLGCYIPYHVQIFFKHAYEKCKRRGHMAVTPADVDDVYHDDMLDRVGDAELSTYEERLQTVLDEKSYQIAFDILTQAAVEGVVTQQDLVIVQRLYPDDGFADGNLLRSILKVLQHDGYLMEKNGQYLFVSKLVRDWWHFRHKAFFVPLTKRGI